MRYIFYYVLQTIIASGLLYGYYHLALRNKKFHHYNRFYLLAATFISITLPLLNIPVYFSESAARSSVVLETLTKLSGSGAGGRLPAVNLHGSGDNWESWAGFIRLIYILVAALILLRIIFSLNKIRRIVKANPVEQLGDVHFVNTNEPGTPFSFFRWLFWNKKIELRSEKGGQIFRHELFHIEQRHSSDIIYLELLTVVCWINPFFYLIKREIKTIHEFLADQFAVTENKKWEYAELLLMQVLATQHHLVNPFFHNQIKRRIAMITAAPKTGRQYLRKLMVFPLIAIITAFFAFSYKTKEASIHGQKPSMAAADTIQPVRLQGNVSVVIGNDTNAKGSSRVVVDGREITVNKISFSGFEKAKVDSGRLALSSGAGNNKDTAAKPLIFLDGIQQTGNSVDDILKAVDPQSIQMVNVLKGPSAIAKYGDMAKDGAIEIVTKNGVIKNEVLVTGVQKAKTIPYLSNKVLVSAGNDSSSNKLLNALVVIDGKIKEGLSMRELNDQLNPDEIESINVLKGKAAVEKYGDKGKSGVIEITTKKRNKNELKEIKTSAS